MFGIRRKKSAAPAVNRPRRSGPPPLLARSGRFALVVVCISLAFGAVGARLFWLHVVDAPRLRVFADEKRRSFRQLSAERGQILDSRGGVFATSHEVWDIIVNPSLFTAEQESRLGEIAESVAKITGKSRLQVLDIFQKRFRGDPSGVDAAATEGAPPARKPAPAAPAPAPAPVPIGSISDEPVEQDESPGPDDAPAPLAPTPANPVAHDAALEADAPEGAKSDPENKDRRVIRWAKVAEGVDLKTRDAIAALRVQAVYSERRFERGYPRKQLAAQLIGYINKNGVASMGIERAFDFFLKGEDGWIDSRQDKRGREMADRRIRYIEPTDGQNVELTIDPMIQQAAEEELAKNCEAYRPEWGIAIVSEAKTGKLLALANWPTFDLNEYNNPAKAPMASQKNRAVTDIYEPGSVFKIVSYAAALQENLITFDSQFNCGPNHREPFYAPYKGKMYKLPKDDEFLGVIDTRKAIAKSSNRAAAQIGMRVAESCGEQKLYDYMAGFGFGSRTGLVTGTEVPGLLMKPSRWQWSTKAATITNLCMGHSVSVTALQTHYAMGVIASGGDLLEPMLVNRISDKTGGAIEFSPVVRKRAITPETAQKVALLLRGVVTDGTGRKANIPGYDVAGKTGTTSMIVKNPITGKSGYSNTENIVSFCGFFPAGNPQIVISVILENPSGKVRGQAFGGEYSAPIFKAIAESTIAWLKIPPANQAAYDEAQARERKKRGLPPVSPNPARPAGALVLEPF